MLGPFAIVVPVLLLRDHGQIRQILMLRRVLRAPAVMMATWQSPAGGTSTADTLHSSRTLSLAARNALRPGRIQAYILMRIDVFNAAVVFGIILHYRQSDGKQEDGRCGNNTKTFLPPCLLSPMVNRW